MDMETKNRQGGVDYRSPQVQILGILPETVLCVSGTQEKSVTLSTGVDWSVGEDAAW